MPTSAARIRANQANSAKSTGPRTTEGKENSRRNGLKHGLTGQGIVVAAGDLEEVEERKAALQAELTPISVMGAILVGQMATLSIRMERAARQEIAAVAERVRHASDDFDAGRIEQAEQRLKAIGDDPRGNLRRLLKSPEGVDVLVEAWNDLRAELTREPRPARSEERGVRMANLLGFRDKDARVGALSRATWGEFYTLAESDGGNLDREARMAWARDRLLERIDAEIAGLEAHSETLDFETIELDRAEAGARALFDPSKEACLARRYESEARRGFFKSLKEFSRAEAEAAERLASPPVAPSSPQDAPLASSCGGDSSALDELDATPSQKSPAASWPVSLAVLREVEVARGDDGRLLPTGRSIPAAA